MTFVGGPEAAVEAAFQAIAKAVEVIDMRGHRGSHPRLGAADVCPFVPVEGVSLNDCAELARRLGRRVGEELGISVYFYEAAASDPRRKNLEEVRKGEYEGLAERIKDPAWKPDCGPAAFNPASGATIIGAREFLIAYNITLNTSDRAAATDIAFELRERGRVARTPTASPYYIKGEPLLYQEGHYPCGNCPFVGRTLEETEQHCRSVHEYDLPQLAAAVLPDYPKVIGQKVRRAGIFKCCKAIGWYAEEYRRAQVSINLTNYRVAPPHLVLERARQLAGERGLVVTGSEIVGVVPYAAMLEAGKFYLGRQGRSPHVPAADILETAIYSMGLNDVGPFEISKKVIGMPKRSEKSLINMRLADFVDEVSRDTPAPGGGSIAALAGALAAALASMVANITYHKTQDAEKAKRLLAIAEKAQRLKDALAEAVDRDTAAFNAYLAALRLPSGTPAEKQLREERMRAGPARGHRRSLSDGRQQPGGDASGQRRGRRGAAGVAERCGRRLRDCVRGRSRRNLERPDQSQGRQRRGIRRRHAAAMRRTARSSRETAAREREPRRCRAVVRVLRYAQDNDRHAGCRISRLRPYLAQCQAGDDGRRRAGRLRRSARMRHRRARWHDRRHCAGCQCPDATRTKWPVGQTFLSAGDSRNVCPTSPQCEMIDVGGAWITPGLIDCHTHLVYGGNRVGEIAMRLSGVSYAEIARQGGGILATVRATRALSESQLVEAALPRLSRPGGRRGYDGRDQVGLRAVAGA